MIIKSKFIQNARNRIRPMVKPAMTAMRFGSAMATAPYTTAAFTAARAVAPVMVPTYRKYVRPELSSLYRKTIKPDATKFYTKTLKPNLKTFYKKTLRPDARRMYNSQIRKGARRLYQGARREGKRYSGKLWKETKVAARDYVLGQLASGAQPGQIVRSLPAGAFVIGRQAAKRAITDSLIKKLRES